MEVLFESDYQKRLMAVKFLHSPVFSTAKDVEHLKSKWTEALSAWHSPYKASVELSGVTINPSSEIEREFQKLFSYLTRFFMRKAVGWGAAPGSGCDLLPITIVNTEDEALSELGIRVKRDRPGDGNFRSQISLENHFEHEVVELAFDAPVTLDSAKITILKAKLMNNLAQWHSSWSLLIDCRHLRIASQAESDFAKLLRVLRGFFLKDVVGYHRAAKDETYAFPCYRSRHRATALLINSGKKSGKEANCQDRK